MNIFFLDKSPFVAAEYLCNKHLSKMQLESAQLISTAISLVAPQIVDPQQPIYKTTHKNHPSAIWMRECLGNYGWLIEHCYGMADEWDRRGHNPHKSFVNITQRYGQYLYQYLPQQLAMTPIPFCGPDELRGDLPKCNNLETTVQLYRQYYLKHKLQICTWPADRTPPFVKEYLS